MLRNNFTLPPTLASKVLASNGLSGMAFSGMSLPPDDPSKEITADEMGRWNKLIAFARKRGYAGKPELDHDPKLRQKVFDEFNKENPDAAIPIEKVKDIQTEIFKYKEKALTDIKGHIAAGRNPLTKGTTVENFMSEISPVDNIFGRYTSNFEFPSAYLIDKQTGEKKKLGFAPKVNIKTAK